MAARWLLGLFGAALALGCSDSTSPGALTLTVVPTSRSLGIDQDSVAVTPDSALVVLTGGGAASARWTAGHGSSSWLTIVTSGGTGSSVLRWVVDPIYLTIGTYVDTIVISVPGAAGSPARLIDSLTVSGSAAQYIAVRRAWLPGERDSTIAFVQRHRTLVFPFVGDLSDLAPQLFAPDSTTVVVANPLYRSAGPAGIVRAPQFASGWTVVGFQLTQINKSVTPNDSLNWLGVKWWNPADSTWVGMVVAATRATTVGLTNVVTSSFDASFGKSGAGGGEAQQSTGTYWEANAGQIQVSANFFCGSATTVASGVYKGGSAQTCIFGGQLVNLTMPRRSGTAAPATQTFSFDFRFPGWISGVRVSCVFPSPCSSTPAPPARPGSPTGNVREALLGKP